jgi:hypothetical protein
MQEAAFDGRMVGPLPGRLRIVINVFNGSHAGG